MLNHPVLGTSRVSETVKPQLLKGYDVPVLGICGVEDVRLRRSRFTHVLLPNSKVMWEV